MSKTWKTQKQIKIIIFHFETFWAIFELVWSRAKRTGKSNYPWGPFLQVFFRGWNSSPPLLLHTLKLGQKQEEEQSFEYVGQENSTNRSTHSLLRTNTTYDEVKYIAKYIFLLYFERQCGAKVRFPVASGLGQSWFPASLKVPFPSFPASESSLEAGNATTVGAVVVVVLYKRPFLFPFHCYCKTKTSFQLPKSSFVFLDNQRNFP